ncbi:NAD(P)-binding protein [Cryphonectria parasitica EP155]|uniref:NAD(P)-binding protein n=1 Tax=Cryphonectria parasitica (strain ATCC 38755 / EP155) TaxID=660469 RepID=A0A9P4Y7V7_CRYP1|nr:NAD(P)-binding protein [Cryphonectria parasitica EP155]KAF3768044.1 NAD(P)-binding protein [Cryphonectria parasitica EP155]
MVKVAVAGGSGQVSREIIDALAASNKHEIVILSRREAPDADLDPAVKWKCVDYNDKSSLIKSLRGVHTLLSFVQLLSDPNQESQKNLIDAAISAGVKRFAPSEYGSKDTNHMAWWQGKQNIRDYLRQVNAAETVLEYTLFQPGLFLDYLAFPYKTAKHVDPLQSVFDYQNCRAMVVEGHEDAVMTLTTVSDLAAVVARAVDYEDRWPTVGGIRGNRLTFAEILDIGERVRGRPFTVDKVKIEDLAAGKLETSWGLSAVHQAVAADEASAMLKAVSIGVLLSSTKGAWDSSDEMNRIFPDYKFTSAEDFLTKVWQDKP